MWRAIKACWRVIPVDIRATGIAFVICLIALMMMLWWWDVPTTVMGKMQDRFEMTKD